MRRDGESKWGKGDGKQKEPIMAGNSVILSDGGSLKPT
jgi:hypothetical protein